MKIYRKENLIPPWTIPLAFVSINIPFIIIKLLPNLIFSPKSALLLAEAKIEIVPVSIIVAMNIFIALLLVFVYFIAYKAYGKINGIVPKIDGTTLILEKNGESARYNILDFLSFGIVSRRVRGGRDYGVHFVSGGKEVIFLTPDSAAICEELKKIFSENKYELAESTHELNIWKATPQKIVTYDVKKTYGS
jgi:hypothetical protein